MTFKLAQFSFDDTQKRASVMLMDEKNSFINCTFMVAVQEDESIEGIKRKAMASLKELTEMAIDDVLKEMPEKPTSPQA